MSLVVTFDVDRPLPQELNRIRGFFERLGWEHLGNTAYRYPPLHAEHPTEDWFNQVIPALMLLRSFARHAAATGRSITRFSIDVQTSTGFNSDTEVGTPPLAAAELTLLAPSRSGKLFGRQVLRDWIDGVVWPYPASGGAAT